MTPPLERHVYESGVRLLKLAGCKVYRLSQPRRTMQTPGLPDVWIFGPPGCFAWWEAKRPGGRLRPEQKEFRAMCLARGIPHVVGGVESVQALLVEWGLGEQGAAGFVLKPQRAA